MSGAGMRGRAALRRAHSARSAPFQAGHSTLQSRPACQYSRRGSLCRSHSGRAQARHRLSAGWAQNPLSPLEQSVPGSRRGTTRAPQKAQANPAGRRTSSRPPHEGQG